MKISRKRIHSLHSVDYTIDLKRALKHLIVSNPSTLFRKKVWNSCGRTKFSIHLFYSEYKKLLLASSFIKYHFNPRTLCGARERNISVQGDGGRRVKRGRRLSSGWSASRREVLRSLLWSCRRPPATKNFQSGDVHY